MKDLAADAAASSSSETRGMRVAVVGGGMCGLTLAIVLARSGIDVQLFESHAGFSEIGAGVTFGANALNAFKLMGVYDTICEHIGQRPRAERITFAVDHKEGCEDSTWSQPVDGVCEDLPVHRVAFIDALTPLLPRDRVQFGKRCSDVTFCRSTGLYQVHFFDGTHHSADLVVGADGIHSNVRRAAVQGLGEFVPGKANDFSSGDRLKEDKNLMFTGYRLYRSLIPYETLKEQGLKTNVHTTRMAVGEKGNLFSSPIVNGTVINVGAFAKDRPLEDNSWQPPLSEPWVDKNIPNTEIMQRFTNWSEESKIILRNMGDADYWALHQVGPKLKTFVKGKVVLVGDAAHASTPFLGAGIGQGIEDVFLIWKLLADTRTTPDNMEAVLKAYDSIRLPRANSVIDASAESPIRYSVLATPGATQAEKDEAMGAWHKSWARTRMHDVQDDYREAVRILEGEGFFRPQVVTVLAMESV